MENIKEKSAVGVGAPATESRENSTTEIITRAIEKINTCGKFKDRYASVIQTFSLFVGGLSLTSLTLLSRSAMNFIYVNVTDIKTMSTADRTR